MAEIEAYADRELLAGLTAHVSAVLSGRAKGSDRRIAALYATGLVGPTSRKSVEPMVRAQLGHVDRGRERRVTGSLTDADWSHRGAMVDGAERMLRVVGEAHGMEAYVLDDTALLKQGKHSVGVANQYAGSIGGLANCQSVVTLAITGDAVHTFVSMELFLPSKWFDDAHAKQREECRVPKGLAHRTKQRIGADLLLAALDSGMPKLPLLMDCAYGDDGALREELTRHGVDFVAMISSTKFFPLDVRFEAAPQKAKDAPGRPATRLLANDGVAPAKAVTYKQLGASLPADAWKTLTWRIGSKGPQTGLFAAVRVRPSQGLKAGAIRRDALQPEQWLLLHRAHGATATTKAWLSNLPSDCPLEDLVRLGRLRWAIERAHQEGKGDVGLDHYEGRTYPGIHHHLALVTLTHQYLAIRQLQSAPRPAPQSEPFSPSADRTTDAA
jgi:SRSO17 transposase